MEVIVVAGWWQDVVRDGYDAVSRVYRSDNDNPAAYRDPIRALLGRVPDPGATVLDLGCGCGVPVARELASAGHEVTGVDFSAVQIDRARRLVPTASFLQADFTVIDFPAGSFDAVVCFYALIHLPGPEQRQMLARIGTWLRPEGVLLAIVGVEAGEGFDHDWLGTGATMWWHHPDLATIRGWLVEAGLSLDTEWFIPEGEGGHQLLLATSRLQCDRSC